MLVIRSFLLNPRFLSVLPVLFLFSCGAGQDMEVQIEISGNLKNELEVVSAQGAKPGALNPVDAVIVLKNTSDSEKQVRLQGSWLDADGNGYGGSGSVINFKPGQVETFRAGTRSKEASVFRLVLTLTQSTQDELLTETLADKSVQIAEGFGMTFTESPSVDEIPQWTPRGVANGEPFQAKTIMFRQDHPPTWRITISDREFDVTKGDGYEAFTHKDLQSIYIDFPREPRAGDLFEQDMSYGGGYFQIKPSPSANSTTSWNTSIAYVIEITKWDKEPSTTSSCNPLQALTGFASGRLYISFKSSDISDTGPTDSWISGEFEDAAIVYCK